MTDLDGLSWTIRTESSLTDFNKPESQIDDVIIHPDFENYQNDIGRFLTKERKKDRRKERKKKERRKEKRKKEGKKERKKE